MTTVQTLRAVLPADPSWLRVALSELGTAELPGAKHNPRIIAYHASTRLAAKTDETPWCSSFANWVMIEAGYTATRSAAASSWLSYGIRTRGRRGTIVVLSRPGGHHVGFVAGMTRTHVWILGGNQGNAVSIAPYSLARVLQFRAPDLNAIRPEDRAWLALASSPDIV